MLDLTQAMTTQISLSMMPRVVERTITSRLRDLVKEECNMAMLQDDMTLARHRCMHNQLKSQTLGGCRAN